MEIEERFWAKVNKDGPNGCWVWTAFTNQLGYGTFRLGSNKDGSRRKVRAHRFAFELTKGSIPQGCELDHLCRNPSCVNPAHLEAVTHQVNMLRGVNIIAANARVTHCPQGHLYDLLNTQRQPYGRSCRICHAAGCKRYRTRLKELVG